MCIRDRFYICSEQKGKQQEKRINTREKQSFRSKKTPTPALTCAKLMKKINAKARTPHIPLPDGVTREIINAHFAATRLKICRNFFKFAATLFYLQQLFNLQHVPCGPPFDCVTYHFFQTICDVSLVSHQQ